MAKAQRSDWLLLILVSIVWGSSFILIKKGLIAFNPFEVAALRVVWAFLVLLPIGWKKLSSINRQDWKYVFVVGLVGTGIPAILFSTAQLEIDSGVSACLNALVPIFTFIWGIILFGSKFSIKKSAGLMLGFFGALVLILFSNPAQFNPTQIKFALLILCAGNCYAISVNTVKNHCSHIPPIALTFASFLLIFPLALLLLQVNNSFGKFFATEQSSYSFLAIAALGVLGTGIANIIFFGIAQRTNALFASTATYLIPIVALGWGFFDNEVITMWHFIGLALIVSGVYIINSKSKRDLPEAA